MTDLTFASHEEIVAEIGRRYPSYLLVVTHRVEGQTGAAAFAHRLDFNGATGRHEPLGLAHIAADEITKIGDRTRRITIGGIPPLDPPHVPPT